MKIFSVKLLYTYKFISQCLPIYAFYTILFIERELSVNAVAVLLSVFQNKKKPSLIAGLLSEDFMSDAKKLVIVKCVHTLIWLVFVAAIVYVCYAGVFDKVDRLVWWCVGAVVFEGIVLLINKWKCPLTTLANKCTDERSTGFDIFLPKWLARHNKILFTALFLVGLSLAIWRTI